MYCELAHLDEILDSQESREILKARLIESFKDKNLKTKIMYGSDWHMPLMINDTDNYLQIFLKFFQESDLVEFINEFFWLNAKAFLTFDPFNNE